MPSIHPGVKLKGVDGFIWNLSHPHPSHSEETGSILHPTSESKKKFNHLTWRSINIQDLNKESFHWMISLLLFFFLCLHISFLTLLYTYKKIISWPFLGSILCFQRAIFAMIATCILIIKTLLLKELPLQRKEMYTLGLVHFT